MTSNTLRHDTVLANGKPTTRVPVSDQDDLDVWVTGEGSPVVLSHGGFWPDLLVPLKVELAKKPGYQLIHYHRRGYGGKPTEPVEFSVHAQDIVKILDALGIEESHVFGHSYSAHIVLDLVAQSPDRVKSAAVAEHVSGFQTGAEQRSAEALAPAIERYESGDREGAAAAFLTAHGASEDLIDQISPGWIDTFFQVDLPALITWDFDPAKLKDSETPIAWMHSSEAVPLFREAGAALQKWAPGTQEIEMADSDHFFPVAKPAETAAALHEWLMSQDTTTS